MRAASCWAECRPAAGVVRLAEHVPWLLHLLLLCEARSGNPALSKVPVEALSGLLRALP